MPGSSCTDGRWRPKRRVEFVMPACMCSHFGLFGHGGGRDPTKCFCTHCKCRMDQRHTLFQLVRLPSSATVAEVAKAYGMRVETLWMLNAGSDPTGHLQPLELTDRALFY